MSDDSESDSDSYTWEPGESSDDEDSLLDLVHVDDSADEDDDDALPALLCRRNSARTCNISNANYVDESVDTFFSNEDPGYTNFHRTRKGGDKRPNGVNSTVSEQS